MATDNLRIVTTNDFFGAFMPYPASFGMIPGGAGLETTVARLREGAAASIWIDVGDFAQGGPLAPASGGAMGFVAASALGIDIGVAGNHEFDWGDDHLRRWAGETGFPLLCANYDVGFPGSTVIAAGSWSVGIIGVTHPQLGLMTGRSRLPQSDPASVIGNHAADLRRQGVDLVVLAIHDGVDWALPPAGPATARLERLERLLAAAVAQVDVVLGGHTLGRFVGQLAGRPFVHPWAFGVEVGIVDIAADRSIRAWTQIVEEAGPWQGPGGVAAATIAAEIVGELPTDLVNAPGRDVSLTEAVANGICHATGADVALISPAAFQTMQPPLDGAFAFLPAGPVSEAALLRLMPWSSDDLMLAELDEKAIAALADGMAGTTEWGSFGPTVIARRDAGRSGGLVALSAWNARQSSDWLGREVAWSPAPVDMRSALRSAFSR